MTLDLQLTDNYEERSRRTNFFSFFFFKSKEIQEKISFICVNENIDKQGVQYRASTYLINSNIGHKTLF